MNLVILGFGYTAQACAARLKPKLSSLAVTARSAEKLQSLRAGGLTALRLDGEGFDPALADALGAATALIVSIPPDEGGDPALRTLRRVLERAQALTHIVYLSTIGVYGDFKGAWIDEATPPNGASERAARRLKAEEGWLAFGRERGVTVEILRLAGIYGPGRNPLNDIARGTARRLFKKDQVFNRIHVEDIALVAEAAFDRGPPGGIWNVTDDEPAPPQDVVAHAAVLLGLEPPPLIDYEQATLSEMARAFYSENKRVSNRAIRGRLGVTLRYPTYREGLAALLAEGEGRNGAASLRQKDRSG